MPFKSQAQRAFMYSRHPAIAKRWERVTPKGKLPYHVSGSGTSSEESPNPRIQKLPRPKNRDFRHLHPGPVQRLKLSKRASEVDAMGEKPTEAHSRGERGKMSLKYRDESRLQGRDVRKAERHG